MTGKYDTNQSDGQCPGGVYLCQTGKSISCGACCGLYNVADPSRDGLKSILERRTDLFQRTRRDYDALLEFRAIVESSENPDRPFPEFHHCPYIGLIGEDRSRPGCLLHPLGLGNNGVDHRGLSHWGGFACATYFCPTCTDVPARYKRILRQTATDWYIYGLVVTEPGFLSTFFSQVESLLGRDLTGSEGALPHFRDAVSRFFELKARWPHRPQGFRALGNYFFKDDLYPRAPIPYETLGVSFSGLDPILTALGSWFADPSDLESAIDRIQTLISDAASSL